MPESPPTPSSRFRILDEVRAPVTSRQRLRRRLNSAKTHAKSDLEHVRLRLQGWRRGVAQGLRGIGQRFFAWDRRTPGVRLLLIVTLAYLLVEFAFSAWLIDVMGSFSDDQTIRRAEHYGRLISGFAVALLCWPWMLKRKSWFSRAALLLAGTYIAMGLVYNLERRLIDHMVASSSAEARAAAVAGTLMRSALVADQVGSHMLDGLWNTPTAQSAPGKAFAGVSAFLVAGSDLARAQTLAIAPEVIRGVIEAQAGGIEAEYDRFQQSQAGIRAQFAQYQEIGKRYQAALAQAGPYADDAWEKYLDSLEARHRYWGRYLIKHKRRDGHLVIEKAVEPTRKAVRQSGIPVPANWNTGDRATFIKVARQEYTRKVRASFDKQLNGVPMNLGLNAFASHGAVQKSWREAIGYPAQAGTLPLGKLSLEQFRKRLYNPTLSHRAKTSLAGYRAAVQDYSDAGAKAAEGRQAYEATIAPVFALTLSLLGALVHLCKVALLGLHAFTGVHFRRGIVKAGVIATVVVAMLASASVLIVTPLTSHQTYRSWTHIDTVAGGNLLQTGANAAVGMALDSIIKAQSFAYPAFNAVRAGLAPLADTAPGRAVLMFLDRRGH